MQWFRARRSGLRFTIAFLFRLLLLLLVFFLSILPFRRFLQLAFICRFPLGSRSPAPLSAIAFRRRNPGPALVRWLHHGRSPSFEWVFGDGCKVGSAAFHRFFPNVLVPRFL